MTGEPVVPVVKVTGPSRSPSGVTVPKNVCATSFWSAPSAFMANAPEALTTP